MTPNDVLCVSPLDKITQDIKKGRRNSYIICAYIHMIFPGRPVFTCLVGHNTAIHRDNQGGAQFQDMNLLSPSSLQRVPHLSRMEVAPLNDLTLDQINLFVLHPVILPSIVHLLLTIKTILITNYVICTYIYI